MEFLKVTEQNFDSDVLKSKKTGGCIFFPHPGAVIANG